MFECVTLSTSNTIESLFGLGWYGGLSKSVLLFLIISPLILLTSWKSLNLLVNGFCSFTNSVTLGKASAFEI